MDKKITLVKSLNLLAYKTLIIFISIIILGLFLRTHNFTEYPRFGSTFDEYAWTWLGINIIKEKTPISWSSHQHYEKFRKHLIFQNTNFWIVKPYLEHPPFFGIVAGSFAILNGTRDMYEISIDKIRPLAIFMGIFSIFLIFFLVREIYGEKLALLSSLIYATIPTVAIGSRIVQNENFFIPMYLAALFLIVKFIKTKKKLFLYVSALLCGLLIISKIPWIAATLGIVAILFYNKLYKDGIKIITITLSFFISYIAYGIYFNQELFFNLWGLQLERYSLTFNSFFAIFTEPYLVDRFLLDGWIYFGWIAFFLLLSKNLKQNFIIIFALLGYLAVFIFAIPNEPGHGWYRYPFYPFLAVSIAIFIREYFNKNLLMTFMFLIFVCLSLLELTWTKTFGFSFSVFRIFLILSASALLPLFFKKTKLIKYSTVVNFSLLILGFVLSIWTVISYTDL